MINEQENSNITVIFPEITITLPKCNSGFSFEIKSNNSTVLIKQDPTEIIEDKEQKGHRQNEIPCN